MKLKSASRSTVVGACATLFAVMFTLANPIYANSMSSQEIRPTEKEIEKEIEKETKTNAANYVSHELFQLIEGWKKTRFTTMALEEFIIEKDEDLYFQWLQDLASTPSEALVVQHLRDYAPNILDKYLAELEMRDERFNVSYFVDYLRTKYRDAYENLRNTIFVEQAADLTSFVQQYDPSLLAEWEKDKTKGDYNIQGSLPAYIDNHYQSAHIIDEARLVLANMGIAEDRLPTGKRGRDDSNAQDRGAECNCSVTITNTGNPNNNNTLHTYAYQHGVEYKNNGSVKRSWSLSRSAMGAAHALRADRFTTGLRDNEVDSSLSTNYRAASLSLGCLDELGYTCAGYCSGEVVAEAQYHADLKADIHISSGISIKHGTAVAADRGKFSLISAGLFGSTETVLFNKALAVEREHQTEYDSDALMALVKSVAGIVSTVLTATDGSALASSISGDAASSLVKNAIGLIKKTGKSSSYIDKDMLAHFSTTELLSNIPFDTSTTRTFKLASDGRVHVEGRNGNHNSGWAQIDSAYYLAVGAKNFNCSGDVTSVPDATSNWSFGRSPNSEMSTPTLQNNIAAFLNQEMGQLPDFSSGNTGSEVTVIPPQPPVAVCSVTPNLGINSLNAVMDGSASSDSDGSIVSYQWLRYPGTPGEILMDTGVIAPLIINDAPKSFMGPGGIHLKVTDDSGLSDTSYCGHVIVKCVDNTGQPCPMPAYPAEKALFAP